MLHLKLSKHCIRIENSQYAAFQGHKLNRLELVAAKGERMSKSSSELPEYPPADRQGNRPAIEFARVSLARSFIEDRRAAGLSQQELARLAGVRQETISRLESGKHSPTVRTVEKIDRVLQKALQDQTQKSARGGHAKGR